MLMERELRRKGIEKLYPKLESGKGEQRGGVGRGEKRKYQEKPMDWRGLIQRKVMDKDRDQDLRKKKTSTGGFQLNAGFHLLYYRVSVSGGGTLYIPPLYPLTYLKGDQGRG